MEDMAGSEIEKQNEEWFHWFDLSFFKSMALRKLVAWEEMSYLG